MSIRHKITALFTILTALIALLLSVFIYFFTKRYVESDFFHRMNVRAGTASKAKFEATDVNVAFYNEIREKHLQRLPEEKEYIFPIASASRTIDSIDKRIPPSFTQNLMSGVPGRFKTGNHYYLANLYHYGNEKYVVFLSAWNRDGLQLLGNLQKNLFTGFVVSVVLMLCASLLASREVVNPLRHIIGNVRTISASNLHLRLKEKTGKDEIASLTQTFNDMLDRLETAFETQSDFVNKAAHELRTPLTAIIGEAELALGKMRSPEEYAKALHVIADKAEQLEHLTSSLLELAQVGNNSKQTFMTELRVDELLLSVKRLMDFTDPGNKVQINFEHLPDAEHKITILGNETLIKLALSNIVQNASKYSRQQEVYLSLDADSSYCIITVRDRGIGIPENELKHIFDPFFRASNTNSFKGYGIGLPLAQKVIRLHRGYLEYSSEENKGTTVKVFLPFKMG